MYQIILIQMLVNKSIKKTLVSIGTSPIPKNAHLKPDIKYTIGFKRAKLCQNGGNISIVQKLPPRNTSGVIINIGTIFNCSKLSETIPIMNPSKLNVTQVKNKKKIIKNG